MPDRVLLTGVSGFLGSHVTLALLDAGYAVRGSVRDLRRAEGVRAALAQAGADTSRLEIVSLDLLSDAGWTEAAAGCRYVQHVASPLPVRQPKDRSTLIRPAVEGTERALHAANAAGAERVVLTSSIAAIMYGHAGRATPYTEADWTELGGPGVSAYIESKTRAERAAWALMAAAGRREALAVINPSIILGPLLESDPGASVMLVLTLLKGWIPAAPRMHFGLVDVRDVAAMHVAAMTAPEAGGRRFIATSGTRRFFEIGDVLRRGLPQFRRRLPHFELPDWFVRGLALLHPELRENAGEIGHRREADNAPARALLGRDFITPEAAILSSAESLIAQKLVG